MAHRLFTFVLVSGLISSFYSSTAPCEQSIKFTTQWGSTAWWLTFYITELCCGTVTSAEVKDVANYPLFVAGSQPQDDDFWIFDNAVYNQGYFTAPITVQVTNSNNDTLTFTDVIASINPDNTYYSDNNTNFGCSDGQTGTSGCSYSVYCISKRIAVALFLSLFTVFLSF
eukprot:UN11594